MVHGRLLGHDAPGVSLVNKTWEICEHGAYRDTLQMQPVTSDWETGWEGTGGDLLRVLWYFIQLMWAFSGVAIIADIFMTAIEEITMATYVKTGKDGKKRVCKVWNDTVANLSLMALGSSAPEIMLNVLDILFGNFFLGDLGPSTIVGSAAFNLLVILGICVYSVGDEPKFIENTKVYAVTASFSIFAYLWLLVILIFWTPDVITVAEGVLTFSFFFLVLGLAYSADKNYFDVFGTAKVSPDGGDGKPRVPLPADMMDEVMVRQLMKTKTGIHGGDMSNATEEEMAAHVEYLMTAMRPVTHATYRNDSLAFMTGKRPRPRITILPTDMLAKAEEMAVTTDKPMLAGVVGGASKLMFKDAAIDVMENCGNAVLTVMREGGTDGQCSCEYATADISATAGKDYISGEGTLTFEAGETEKTISIAVIDSSVYEGKEKFRVALSSPTNASLEGNGIAVVTIIDDDKNNKGRFSNVLNRVRNRDKMDTIKAEWWRQIVDSIQVPHEEGQAPTMGNKTIHCIVVPWKALFSLVPPPALGGGWAAFSVALTFIAFVTMYIGDTAEFLGCALGLDPGVTAITFVAVGTSLPDTFASKRAAEMDEHADNSVGNVTGSNCVNVFLGLGLPWMMGAIYWSSGTNEEWLERYGTPEYAGYESVKGYIDSGVFVVYDKNLGFSVVVFSICAVTCLMILQFRRVTYGGELGGPAGPKKATAAILVMLWFVYAVFSVCKVYVKPYFLVE